MACALRFRFDTVRDIRLSEEMQLWRKEDTLRLLERLSDAMHFRQVNKSELARLLGIRGATVTQWFSLERLPDTDVLLSAMRLLGGEPNWWLRYGEGTSAAPPRDRLEPPPHNKTQQVKRVAGAVKASQKGTQPKKQAGRKDG